MSLPGSSGGKRALISLPCARKKKKKGYEQVVPRYMYNARRRYIEHGAAEGGGRDTAGVKRTVKQFPCTIARQRGLAASEAQRQHSRALMYSRSSIVVSRG
jgi:hypothetical protein